MTDPETRLQTRVVPRVDSFARAIIALLVDVLVFFMVVVLIWAVVALGLSIWHTIAQRNPSEIKDLVIGVLTVFIVIEMFDLFREYARSSHVKLTNLAEVSLAVVLRELWLLLLDGSENWQLYLSLAGLVLAVAGFWYLANRAEKDAGQVHKRAGSPPPASD